MLNRPSKSGKGRKSQVKQSPQHAFDDSSSIPHRSTQCVCEKEGEHFDTLVMDTVLPGTPEKIYNLMFSRNHFGLIARRQKFEDIKISDWHPDQSDSQLLTRTMTYMKPCKDTGSGRTECKLKDETLHVDFDDYVSTLTTTRTPDAPGGKGFAVKTRTCIMWAGVAASRLVVSTTVERTRTGFLMPIIETNAIDEQKQHYTVLEAVMRDYIADHRAEFVPKGVSSRRTRGRRRATTSGVLDSSLSLGGLEISAQQSFSPLGVEGTTPATPGSSRRNPTSTDAVTAASEDPGDDATAAIGDAHTAADTTPENTPSQVSSTEMFQRLVAHGCVDLSPHIDPDQYSDGFIAGGGFSDIWKGKLRNGTEVAIKVWRRHSIQHSGPKYLKRATREIYHWSKAKHGNIQELMGVIMFQGRLGMVSLWMAHGNLREYLHKYPRCDRYSLCTQVATGVHYLHSQRMVHGDLKAVNVLISRDGVAKLSDFDHSIMSGLSLVFSETTNTRGGTTRWMAPELILDSSSCRNMSTDIYALGMTMLEIITGTLPYPECREDHHVILAVMRKRLPKRQLSYFGNNARNSQIWELLLRCWNYEPQARPKAAEVLESLGALASD